MLSERPATLRIIGGKWRGKKISFPPVPGLRPTPDRVRETLFNWLTPQLRESVCLDLFAGSGILGLEALSRGANFVQFVDSSVEVIHYLRKMLSTLHITQANIIQNDSRFAIIEPTKPFDIVFIDPPYKSDLLFQCCQWLIKPGYLAPNAFIYMETNQSIDALHLPNQWHIQRSQKAGQIHYYLIRNTL